MKLWDFEKKHPGITYAIVSVILFSVFCLLVLLNYRGILNIVGRFFGVLSPIFIGLLFALILFPLQNRIEQLLVRLGGKRKKAAEKAINADSSKKLSAWWFFGKHKQKARGGKPHRAYLRFTSIILAALAVLALISAFFVLIIPQAAEGYSDLSSKAKLYTDVAKSFIDDLSAKFGSIDGAISERIADTLKTLLNDTYKLLSDLTPYILNLIKSSVKTTTDITLGLVISIYILLDRERLIRILHRLLRVCLPEGIISNIDKESDYIAGVINRYSSTKMIGILFTIVVCFPLFLIFRLPYAALLAIIIAFMNVIPYIGIFIGMIPGLFIIFITSPDKILIYLIIILAYHLFDTKVIEVYILKCREELDPSLTVISIVLLSGLFGFWAMFVAVPISTLFCHFLRNYIRMNIAKKNNATLNNGNNSGLK